MSVAASEHQMTKTVFGEQFLIEKTDNRSTEIAIKFVSGLRFILFDMSHHEYVPSSAHESYRPQIAIKLVSASNNIQICGGRELGGLDQLLAIKYIPTQLGRKVY